MPNTRIECQKRVASRAASAEVNSPDWVLNTTMNSVRPIRSSTSNASNPRPSHFWSPNQNGLAICQNRRHNLRSKSFLRERVLGKASHPEPAARQSSRHSRRMSEPSALHKAEAARYASRHSVTSFWSRSPAVRRIAQRR